MTLHTKFKPIFNYFAGDIRNLVDPHVAIHTCFYQNTQNNCNDQLERIFYLVYFVKTQKF